MLRKSVFIALRRTGLLEVLKRIVPRRARSWLGRLWGRGEDCWTLDDGSIIHYPTDFYWLQYTDNRSYEPELWETVIPLLNENTLFIDGGANIGLWSSVAAAKIGRRGQVVAVEAAAGILPWLKRNSESSRIGFEVLDRAIWSADDRDLIFYEHLQHAGSSLDGDRVGANTLNKTSVKTVTVDRIVEEVAARHPSIDRIVVKLDVEGSERDAFLGSRRSMKTRNILFIYEEVGDDKFSEATRHLLEETKLNLYFRRDSDVVRIERVEQVDAIKVDPKKGYNFMATMPDTELDQVMGSWLNR